MGDANTSMLLEEDDAEGCEFQLVCNSNATEDDSAEDFIAPKEDAIRLDFLTHPNALWIKNVARRFEALKRGAVKIEVVSVTPLSELFKEIINEATGQLAVYDGFITPPSVVGSVVEFDGWTDLTPYIQESAENIADWTDILLGYRKSVAQYQGKNLMYPLDGDILSLYFRKDVLDHFGLGVPRTWDEYNEVAAVTHGQVFENQTLTGSCIGRVRACAGAYWANLLISSITQTQGDWSGHLFDTEDMTPLTTVAVMQQVLQWQEGQVKYGAEDEFEACTRVNIDEMLEGACVLTYNWGGSFKPYLSRSDRLVGKFGVAPTPGSKRVLDRETGELVDCDEKTCRYGRKYEDIGWVNHAPYLAFGGFSCVVNNFTDPVKKRIATEFCAFASSREESAKDVVRNATDVLSFTGQDPFRVSHLDVDLYVTQGYERDTAQQFVDAIRSGLESPNAVTDIRFPTATEIYDSLDRELHDYLKATKHGLIPETTRESERTKVTNRMVSHWLSTIAAHDAQGSTKVSVMETYQKLRGVYIPDTDYNHIQKIRGFGFALSGIIMASSLAFSAWTIRYRKSPVVRASQPFFLVMICTGALVFGSALFPLGIDDSVASIQACSRACMSIPWLITLGWSILFSGLFAKLRRVNIVFRNAARFRRVTVTRQDVLVPAAVLFTCNTSLLLVWTLLSPLKWERRQKSTVESYGACTTGSESAWKVCLTLLVLFNFATLLMANVEAFKARAIQVEYGESLYIGLAMISMLQISLVGLPLLFLVADNPSANYFVRSTMVFSISMSFLLFLFVPKLTAWVRKADERRIASTGIPTGLSFRNMPVSTEPIAPDEVMLSSKNVEALTKSLTAEGIDAVALFEKIGISTVHDNALKTIQEESSDISQGAASQTMLEDFTSSSAKMSSEEDAENVCLATVLVTSGKF